MATTVYKHDDRIVAFQNKICIAPITVPPLAEFTINTTASPQDFTFYLDTPSSLVVEWGDGTSDTTYTTTGNKTHSYADAGDHTLKVKSGTVLRLAFGVDGCTPLRLKAVTRAISASLGLTSALEMFAGCLNCTSWAAGFFDAASANVTSIKFMFHKDGTWDWRDFNENLNGWNTGKVTDAGHFMNLASSYNQPMNNWDMSKAENIDYMFYLCGALNQNVSAWNIEGVTSCYAFMAGVTLSTANYDALLISWGAQAVHNGLNISFGDSKYTAGGAAEAARTHLVDIHGWTITDGGPA